jgi:exportin-7
MDSVYQFTTESVRSINVLPNSKHYLLGFWASIVNPLIYLKEKAPKNLDSCIQQITLMYLESRLILADTPPDPDVEDPLEDEVLRAEQLDVIASLGRCKYQDTAQYILQKFEEVQNQGTTGAMLSAVYEKKLTWIVYMMGALVGGHSGCKPNRTDTEGMPTHVVNGEIASRVFRLLTQTDVQPNASELLESAYLYFIEQFRKVYIGEHAKQVVQQEVNERLCTVLGLEDENAVLSVLIKKIGTNLQKRYHMESVLKKTLLLFHELAAGINIVHSNDRSPHLIVSGRLLLKNETVKSVLTNHASTEFGFLHGGVAFGKYRTMYYHSLAKLLFMEIRDNRDQFEEFMAPMSTVLNQLWALSNQNVASLREPQCQLPLVGLCRDLRGVCQACASSETYNLLFDWLVDNPKSPMNSRVCLFSRALEQWSDVPEVTTPLLKFMAEFVNNKSQRITFDQSSPNGILLFREASKILVTYGTRILQRTEFQDIYRQKYKGIGNALQMFCQALHGNYTNFGVFELYGDQSLSQSLNLALQMCLSVPFQDLQSYQKPLKSYYFFIELASRNHMGIIMQLQQEPVSRILLSIEEGLISFDTTVNMQCCAAVDNIVNYVYPLRTKQNDDGLKVQQFLGYTPPPLRRILHVIMSLVVSGEFSSTWSISRPLLGLILLQEQAFFELKEQLISSQIQERQTKMRSALDELIVNVKDGLNAKNKDSFTRNLYTFSQVVRTIT